MDRPSGCSHICFNQGDQEDWEGQHGHSLDWMTAVAISEASFPGRNTKKPEEDVKVKEEGGQGAPKLGAAAAREGEATVQEGAAAVEDNVPGPAGATGSHQSSGASCGGQEQRPVSNPQGFRLLRRVHLKRAPEHSRLSQLQLQELESSFQVNQYPSGQMRCELGRRIGVTENRVQIWFRSRRTRWRRSQRTPRIRNAPCWYPGHPVTITLGVSCNVTFLWGPNAASPRQQTEIVSPVGASLLPLNAPPLLPPLPPMLTMPPVSPVAPMAPVAPVAPMAPVAPVAPMAPVAPVATVLPMPPVPTLFLPHPCFPPDLHPTGLHVCNLFYLHAADNHSAGSSN